jgi:hypothetical protein
MKALIAYAIKWSGGDVPIFVQRFQAFTKMLRSVSRLSGPIMQELSDADMGMGRGARFRCVVMMVLASSEKYLIIHAKSLSKVKREPALLAEQQMLKFDAAIVGLRAQMPQVSSDHETIMALKSADHDMQCVFLVHSISRKHNTLREVAAATFTDMAQAVGMMGVPTPFVILRSEKDPIPNVPRSSPHPQAHNA